MAKIVYVEMTFDGLEQLLRDAAEAHHIAMGNAPDDWAKWYAQYIWGKTAEDHKIIDTDKDTAPIPHVNSIAIRTEAFSEYDDTSEQKMMGLIDA